MKRLDPHKVIAIHELYPCIQAEGSRVGRPTICVRVSGCSHRCFVDIPGKKESWVYLQSGKRVRLKHIVPGDVIMAWDEKSQSIVTTTVEKLEINDVSEYVIVNFEKYQHLCVTPEHPFLTTRGWKMAIDLLDSDELVHVSGRMRNSWRMTVNNPMKHHETVAKVHNHPNYKNFANCPDQLKKTHESRFEKRGTLHPDALLTEKERNAKYANISENMRINNPMFNPIHVSSSIASKHRNGFGLGWSMGQEMSSCEMKFWNLIVAHGLENYLWFTGNGGFTLYCSGKLKIPDFKVHGENKFIEVGEESWFRQNWDDYEKELYEIYSKSSSPDTKYLAINMNLPDDEIISRVKTFLTNGIKIKSVKKIKSSKTYKSYNLHCKEFHNYLVDIGRSEAVISHNCWFGEEGGWCDAWQSSIHPEKGKFTLNDVFEMYQKYPQVKEMMFTGGSPTMHPEILNEMTIFCNKNDIFLTVETEGSHFIETKYKIDLISLSPKFSNSIPNLGILTPGGKIVDQKFIDQHNKLRLNYDAIEKLLSFHKDFHYKPVWDGREETLKEIEDFRVQMNIPKSKTFMMPAGDSRQKLLFTYPLTMDKCLEMGYNFTGRPHIIAYDQQRFI